jgi:hypothetical protein
VVLLGAGCGQGDDAVELGTGEGVAAFAQAVEASREVDSGRFDLRVEVGGGLGLDGAALEGDGAWSAELARTTLRSTEPGAEFEVTTVMTPDAVYQQWPFDGGPGWIAIDAGGGAGGIPPGVGGVGRATDPSALLAVLDVAADDVRDLGEGEVGGEPTTVFGVTTTAGELLGAELDELDREKVEEALGGGHVAQLEAFMGELSLDFTVDVGGDGLVRRIVVVWDMEGAMRATADLFPGLSEDELREGGAAVSQTQELTFRDLGEPVTIEVPDEADVVEAGGLLGG